MEDLDCESKNCRTIKSCIELATRDTRDEMEEAVGWLICFEEIFNSVIEVKVLGLEASLVGFDLLKNCALIAICKRKNKKAKVALESIEFSSITKLQLLWIKAWIKWSNSR
jgi:hypothetical protein